MSGRRDWKASDAREEIRFHLEMHARELEEQGYSPEEARRRALDAFGDPDRIEREVAEVEDGNLRWSKARDAMTAVFHDMKYAGRFLRRNPGFAAVVLGTLALGIGANTAIFSLLDQALLRAPAVRDPGSLVAVYTTSRRGFPRASSSYPDYQDYRDRASSIADLAAMSSIPASLGDDERGARLLTVETVTGNAFDVLGLTAEHGRLIQLSDDSRGAGVAVVALSHSLWESQYGADPAVIGSTVRLNGRPFQVVGVMDADYKGLALGDDADAWVPMQAAATMAVGSALQEDSVFYQRQARWIGRLVGRLAPGATVDRARAELLGVSEQLRIEDPDARGPRSVTVDPLARYLLPRGNEAELSRFIMLLAGVVGITLLLASANLANLLLARASTRESEIGVRLAVGASRWRLVRQLLAESLALAVVGGAAGLLVAHVLLRALSGFALPGGVSIAALDVGLDGRVLVATLVLSVLTTVLFGLVPALQSTRPRLMDALRSGRAPEGRNRSSVLRGGLIAVQMALCLVLLVGSGLFIRTLRNALRADFGVRTEGVALARFNLGPAGYDEMGGMTFVRTLRDRAEALPGVETASMATLVPFQGGGFVGTFFTVDGYAAAPDEELRTELIWVMPRYFQTLGIGLLEGRDFTDGDSDGDGQVVIVSRAMADRYWPGGQALGGVVRVGDAFATVVGIADDVRWSSLDEEATNAVYAPMTPRAAASRMITAVVRSPRGSDGLIASLGQEIRRLDPDVSPRFVLSMDDLVGRLLMPQRLGALLLSAFGILSLVLATVGIVGVVSYRVREQRRAIGIRMALGARREQVLWQVMRGAARPLAVGLLIGIVGALALQGTVSGFLFGVPASDPLTYAAVAALLGAVAFLATLVPARAAARVDPVQVLKAE